MKNASLLVCLLTFGTLGLTARAVVPASPQNASPMAISAAATGQDQTQHPQESKTFTGKIVQSSEGKFVLQDTSGNSTYLLDDQEKAKAFNGKNVKVTGMLDADNNIIHVVDIQEA